MRRQNIRAFFRKLDKKLLAKNETRELTIFGSGSLIMQGITRQSRATVDIDLVDPEMDMTLQLVAADIGDDMEMDMTWLNSAGYIHMRNFPKGWKTRTEEIYNGKAIVVKTLGRRDLIATKLNALCTRGLETDMDDLLDLNPSKADLDFAKKWILSLEKEVEPDFIDSQVKEILTRSRSRGRER